MTTHHASSQGAEGSQMPRTDSAPPAFPFTRETPLHPPGRYRELRLNAPISRVRIWDGGTPWLVTRYEDARSVLTDPRFSADDSLPAYPGVNQSMTQVRKRYPTFVTMDNPEHDQYRRLLTRDFTIRRVEQLRPEIRQSVSSLIDRLVETTPPTDFIEAFALALPSEMICMLLGVPYEDHELFQRLAHVMASGRSTREQADQAVHELCEGYLRGLIERKAKDPGEDILSRLVAGPVAAGELTQDNVVALGRLLLVAGHDTTASMLGLSTFSLLTDPGLRESIVADSDIVPAVVEELLRFWNIDNFGISRVATEDVKVGDQLIKQGDGVLVAGPSADRDESVFADPDELNPYRENVRAHNAFGYGIHQCLGQNLARIELQEAITGLLTRLPNLELATSTDEVVFGYEMFNYGVEWMLVRW